MVAVTELLRGASLRATPQRVRVLELLGRQKKPISVEALVTSGKGAFDTTTAYRALDVLTRGGLVRRINLDRERALYEIAGEHHHHAVCRFCGTIRDISACVPIGLSARVCASSGFASIDSHSLEFYGMCTSCAAKA